MRPLAASIIAVALVACTTASSQPVVTSTQGPTVVPISGGVDQPASGVLPTPATVSPTMQPVPPTAFPTQGVPPTVRNLRSDALHQPAERGDLVDVQRLIAAGADINGRDARGRTPLLAATHGNQPSIVSALIAAGADQNLQDDLKDTPFLYAGASGFLEIVQITHQAGANTRITNRYGGTALIPAAERGHVEVVQYLISRTDVDINHVNNLGWTALLEAIVLGTGDPRRTDVVRLLVQAGADVNLADRGGVTPLAHARQRGYREMIDVLQRAGAR